MKYDLYFLANTLRYVENMEEYVGNMKSFHLALQFLNLLNITDLYYYLVTNSSLTGAICSVLQYIYKL